MAFANCGKVRHPCRMSLVDLTFLPVLISETPIDPDFRQPVRTKKYGKPKIIKGTPNFGTKQKKLFDQLKQTIALNWNSPGNIPDTIGYIVFSKIEIERAGYLPSIGDLFVGYPGFEKREGLELMVEEVRPESPLGGSNLFYMVELRSNRDKR